MNRTIAATLLRLLLTASVVGAVFAVVLGGLPYLVDAPEVLPFLAAALSVAVVAVTLPAIDRLVQGLSQHPTSTPYSALAKAAARTRAGTLQQVLSDLARILAEGTGAQQAALWLSVKEELVSAARYPAADGAAPGSTAPGVAANLAVLLAQPEVDHVVPVLDGPVLRAALAIGKPGLAVTPADRRLMHDLARGAGLLLRGAQLDAELAERVRRAEELAAELQASRRRLRRARELERQRLVGDLTQVTTDRLAALRNRFTDARAVCEVPDDGTAEGTDEGRQDGADDTDEDTGRAGQLRQTLGQARAELDELIERFRMIARGVYPAVLRDQGPAGALDELATGVRRPVRMSGTLSRRLAWEVESGIYYLAASAMQLLGDRPAPQPLQVHLEHTEGWLGVRITDPALDAGAGQVLSALADDVHRLAALGGAVELVADSPGAALRAWLPDQLEPPVEDPSRRVAP